jgi:ABC-type phosphate/phosphonate transport system permease subunit
MSEQVSFQHDEILRRDDAARLKRGVAGLGLVVAILLSCWMTGVFDIARFADSWAVGMVGKFFAESIEHVDPKPIEAARAAGATPLQVIWHAVLPQVMPQLADTTIYRWEYNFRASTVLGAVGAGGIGFELIAALRILEYAQVSAILICILACVTVVDGLGAALRKALK